MIGPISMVMIGMLLAGVDWKQVFGKRRIYGIVFLKMIVVPGIITLCLKLAAPLITMENAQTILLISLLAVIAPTAGNDHTDGAALQEGCGICKFDQCIYHVGVHRDDAVDGDVVYDVKCICIKSDGERNYAD